jgi:hypothetical protein
MSLLVQHAPARKAFALGQKAGTFAAGFGAQASQSWQTLSAMQNWQMRTAGFKSRPKRLCANVSVSNPSRSIISDMFRARRLALSKVNLLVSELRQPQATRTTALDLCN